MEYSLHYYDLRVKDSREGKPRVVLQGIGFDIAVQSILIVIVSIRSVWVDLCNYYEMRELV